MSIAREIAKTATRIAKQTSSATTTRPKTQPSGSTYIKHPEFSSPEFNVLPTDPTQNLTYTIFQRAIQRSRELEKSRQESGKAAEKLLTEAISGYRAIQRRRAETPSARTNGDSIQRLADQFEQSRRRTDGGKRRPIQPFVPKQNGVPTPPTDVPVPGGGEDFIETPRWLPGLPPGDRPVATPEPEPTPDKPKIPRIPEAPDCATLQKAFRAAGLKPPVCGRIGRGGFDIRGRR